MKHMSGKGHMSEIHNELLKLNEKINNVIKQMGKGSEKMPHQRRYVDGKRA